MKWADLGDPETCLVGGFSAWHARRWSLSSICVRCMNTFPNQILFLSNALPSCRKIPPGTENYNGNSAILIYWSSVGFWVGVLKAVMLCRGKTRHVSVQNNLLAFCPTWNDLVRSSGGKKHRLLATLCHQWDYGAGNNCFADIALLLKFVFPSVSRTQGCFPHLRDSTFVTDWWRHWQMIMDLQVTCPFPLQKNCFNLPATKYFKRFYSPVFQQWKLLPGMIISQIKAITQPPLSAVW